MRLASAVTLAAPKCICSEEAEMEAIVGGGVAGGAKREWVWDGKENVVWCGGWVRKGKAGYLGVASSGSHTSNFYRGGQRTALSSGSDSLTRTSQDFPKWKYRWWSTCGYKPCFGGGRARRVLTV